MDKNYTKKIEEFRTELEDVVRKLGTAKYNLEEAEKARMIKAEQTKALDVLIDGKKLLLAKMDERVKSKQNEDRDKLRPNEGNISILEQSIVYLKSLLKSLESGLTGVVEKQREGNDLAYKISSLKTELGDVNKKVDESALILKDNLSKSEDIKVDVLAMVNQAQSQMESAGKMLETVDQEIKRVEFYARRLKKFYADKGWPLPADLGDFGASKVVYSHKTIERLKQHV